MIIAFGAGIVLGIMSGAHCIGMCGPLALALPIGQQSAIRFFIGRLLYNGGRVATYIVLGAAIGLVGLAVPMPEVQRWIAVGAGISVILFSFVPRINAWLMQSGGVLGRLSSALGKRIGELMRRDALPGLFLLGILNGLLPCGLVYVALAAALGQGSPDASIMFMAGFGAGTIPVMLGVSLFPRVFSTPLRARLLRVAPFVSLLVGVLLILRGLNLGIPYVSPKLHPLTEQSEPECCH